jgi:hypothetical protein
VAGRKNDRFLARVTVDDDVQEGADDRAEAGRAGREEN